MEKKIEKKKEKFEQAFGGVWGKGPDDVAKARKLQLAGKIDEAKEVFSKAVEKLEKDKVETKESDFPYHAKYRGYIAEVNALTALVKGTLKEIEGKDATADLKEAATQYKELEHALDALAGTCDSGEDIAEMMFKCEAEAARKISEGIEEKLGKKKGAVSSAVKQKIITVLEAWIGSSGDYSKSENAGKYSSRGSDQLCGMLECVKKGDYSGAEKANRGVCSDLWDAGYDWDARRGGYTLLELDKAVNAIGAIAEGKEVKENFLEKK